MTNTHTTKQFATVTATVRAANPLKENAKKLKIYLSDEQKRNSRQVSK